MAANGVHGSYRTWKVGFYNCASGKYLTTEKFGEVNVTGNSLKKLQVFTIEQDTADKKYAVNIRSHLGRYMVADRHGNAKVEGDERPADSFNVEYSPDGKWAFKHSRFDNYLGGTDKTLRCYNKSPQSEDWWNIQLYVHPQIHLYNCGRKAYANVNKKNDDSILECKDEIPWGADSLITLVFTEGKYSIKTCNNRYLSSNGDLLDEMTETTRFTLEMHSGTLAFKDAEGRYLMGVGNKGMLKTKSKSISQTRDELFIIYDSSPQVQIISQNGEGKSVSVKQGLEVSANQFLTEELGDTEIFQMEYDRGTETWAFVTHTNKYWTLKGDHNPTIQIATEKTKQSQFTIEWQEDGSVAFKGSDGNYIANKQTGVMYSHNKDEINKFVINIVNRPLLVLKGEHGFVGLINKGTQCVCNTPTYDTFSVSCKGNGVYNLKASTGQFLSLDDSKTLVLDDSSATDFQFKFCGGSQLAIKVKGGNFLRGEQNGIIKVTTDEDAANYSLWEF